MQRFAQLLEDTGLAPISRARTLAATKSLFGFCQRIRYIAANPAAELVLPSYENRLSERIVGELEVRRLVETDAKPRDGVRRLAGCFGSMCTRAGTPARLRCSGRTEARDQSR